VTVPADVVERLTTTTLLGAVALALLLLIDSSVFWRIRIHHYCGVSA
jgi:hypothetical protein